MQDTNRYTKLIGPVIGVLLLYLIISAGINQFNADRELLRELDIAGAEEPRGGEEGSTEEGADADSEGQETEEGADADSEGQEAEEGADADSEGQETEEGADADSEGQEAEEGADADSEGQDVEEDGEDDEG